MLRDDNGDRDPQTLSSLALVFALHVFKVRFTVVHEFEISLVDLIAQPTPLYFMDEIDAALDFRNVSIVANYIKDRTKNAQFIIISLRYVDYTLFLVASFAGPEHGVIETTCLN